MSPTVAIGVTGHRVLSDPEALVPLVDAGLTELAGDRPIRLLTSLAEGADRLVAHRVLARPGGSIVAVLPLPVEEYLVDFADEASVAEFTDLLARASAVEVVGSDAGDRASDHAPDREAAYEAAGFAVADRCEGLLALWDRRPERGRGGTATVVERAMLAEKPVVVVEVMR